MNNMKYITPKAIAIASTATVLAGLLGMHVWREQHRPKILEIYVFPLKSGNSIFIRTPDDMRYIINGGANSEIIRHITNILPFYSRKIDGIFATDVDPKNVGGLISIIERYGTEKVYLPSETIYSLGLVEVQNDAYKVLLDTIDTHKVKIEKLSAGMSVALGSSTKMEILFPISTSTMPNFEYSKASSPQLIMRIVSNRESDGKTVVILGEASKKIQKSLKIEKSDVLIMSNGASEDQLDPAVAEKIAPKFVIYSKSETPAKKSSSNSKSSSTIKPNLLFAKILPQDRFNVKKGTVKITIYGYGTESKIELMQND